MPKIEVPESKLLKFKISKSKLDFEIWFSKLMPISKFKRINDDSWNEFLLILNWTRNFRTLAFHFWQFLKTLKLWKEFREAPKFERIPDNETFRFGKFLGQLAKTCFLGVLGFLVFWAFFGFRIFGRVPKVIRASVNIPVSEIEVRNKPNSWALKTFAAFFCFA